ncbi:xanthine dehydrogenase family protein molybdopterin-binding subunit [Cognatiyoonia sp. IB215182]|uniref:xanthine dehydrogenase family protein molybdopterin-binding subunit n=1 Tax=Cognatiyoonia sp. IB215182 TaxID=3097353 RepID=UPI002A0EAB54|nr:molybdopterin cofactor-binding domain-containing protein [Cognatiyoonia sp. IB215182]MDX8350867.1 molybdopterin cofactor-binding domain-containing protein [Cognatiyoonia sp. IB215182]
MTISTSRRAFLAGAASLTVPLAFPAAAQMTQALTPELARWPETYLRLDADGAVTCILPTCEMGQGTHTGQAMILAEELGADWRTIRIEMPTQPSEPYRLPFGQMRSVGSYGIRYFHDPMRRAAAQMRMMLTQAAADRFGVPKHDLEARAGMILHAATSQAIPFSELVASARLLPVPAEPKLRPEAERMLTGTSVPRLDTPAKTRGEAIYAIDVTLHDMAYGAVRLAPVFIADVASLDASSVTDMPGVISVAQVPRGAVVVAETWWQAKQAADALDITFTETDDDVLDEQSLQARIVEGLDRVDVPMTLMRGDPQSVLDGTGTVIDADYAVPLLAHACMEPINCTARASENRTELWAGTQGHDWKRMMLERELGIPSDQLFINTTYLGGGFGRKTWHHDAVQAVLASRAAGGRPVKVIWTREDDTAFGMYRQTMQARFRGAVDADGHITAMTVRVAGPQMEAAIVQENNMDPFSLLGLVDQPYAVPNYSVDHAVVDIPVPLSAWRAIATSFTGYWMESFIDELAVAAGMDPLEFRLLNLPADSRARPVLERVAEMAGWNATAPQGVHRGVSVVGSYGSMVAQVAEIELVGDRVTVPRVFAAIDCGRAIHPGQVETQIQGSVIDALGPVLRAKITLENGAAMQSNFPDYPLIRMDEAPEVTVDIVDTGAPLGGVGEPGVPPLAGAVCNAVFAATGRRIRSLPLADHDLA